MRRAHKKKIMYCGVFVIVLIILLHPDMNSSHSYEYISKENILRNLHEETAKNYTSVALTVCDYHDVIFDETTLSISLVDGDLMEGHKIREGGEYSPSDCRPKYSTAIIVPYRDNAEQLRGFLVYMHTFFHHQHVHYRIFVVEQVDSKPFNQAKLMNIGAVAAMRAGYPCLILHDVDLLPLKPANLYACTKTPRDMSSNIDQFRFGLPYSNLFGGVISILSKQYQLINGMSNKFFGRIGHNEDLYSRLVASDFKLCRFEPETSSYHLTTHQGNVREQHKEMRFSRESMEADGLSSLKYEEVATVLHPLFTHIMVDL